MIPSARPTVPTSSYYYFESEDGRTETCAKTINDHYMLGGRVDQFDIWKSELWAIVYT